MSSSEGESTFFVGPTVGGRGYNRVRKVLERLSSAVPRLQCMTVSSSHEDCDAKQRGKSIMCTLQLQMRSTVNTFVISLVLVDNKKKSRPTVKRGLLFFSGSH